MSTSTAQAPTPGQPIPLPPNFQVRWDDPRDAKLTWMSIPQYKTLYGAKILSTGRNRGWRLPEIIVDDTSQNILPFNQAFCTSLRA
jgi:hypothetical protein